MGNILTRLRTFGMGDVHAPYVTSALHHKHLACLQAYMLPKLCPSMLTEAKRKLGRHYYKQPGAGRADQEGLRLDTCTSYNKYVAPQAHCLFPSRYATPSVLLDAYGKLNDALLQAVLGRRTAAGEKGPGRNMRLTNVPVT